jgi:hypothetical protein
MSYGKAILRTGRALGREKNRTYPFIRIISLPPNENNAKEISFCNRPDISSYARAFLRKRSIAKYAASLSSSEWGFRMKDR